MNKTAWIIGASTGLGRQVAELLAQQGVSVIVSSRNERDLTALCNHIQTKFQTAAHSFLLDLDTVNEVSIGTECINKLLEKHEFPDSCYFLSGAINDKDENLLSANVLNSLMQLNFSGPVFLINEILKRKPGGPIRVVVASSVAAVRARGKNIAYGAAKRALEQYCSGLMHALADSNVTLHVYRFGYMDTNLSYGQKLPFPAAVPAKIAAQIIADNNKSSGIYYRPKFWWFISLVLNLIPWGIYKKLKF